MMVSLDGFIEGQDKELDWHIWDEETEAYMYNVLNSVDGILLGRVSYELILLKQPLVRRLNTT